jgi:hypothetical protein
MVPRSPPPGYVLMSEDTPYEVELRLLESYRAMSPERKLLLIGRLLRSGDQLALAGLRIRHPDADEKSLVRLLLELKLASAERDAVTLTRGEANGS